MYAAEVIVFVDEEGNMKPLRFRINENDEKIVIKVKTFWGCEKRKDWYVYRCQCLVNNALKNIKLYLSRSDTKWYCEI